jgi:hypothetical protein
MCGAAGAAEGLALISARGPPTVGCRLSAAELAPARWSATRCAAGTLVLVPEDQATLFEIVGGHLDGDAIAGQRLDPVLFHLAGGIGNDFVPGIELHPIAGVRQDFGDQSFELDQFFFRHMVLQIEWRFTRAFSD